MHAAHWTTNTNTVRCFHNWEEQVRLRLVRASIQGLTALSWQTQNAGLWPRPLLFLLSLNTYAQPHGSSFSGLMKAGEGELHGGSGPGTKHWAGKEQWALQVGTIIRTKVYGKNRCGTGRVEVLGGGSKETLENTVGSSFTHSLISAWIGRVESNTGITWS